MKHESNSCETPDTFVCEDYHEEEPELPQFWYIGDLNKPYMQISER
ncbi:MAG: hypothetical protein ACFFCI_18225 [Promethearchaeota archaeon]